VVVLYQPARHAKLTHHYYTAWTTAA